MGTKQQSELETTSRNSVMNPQLKLVLSEQLLSLLVINPNNNNLSSLINIDDGEIMKEEDELVVLQNSSPITTTARGDNYATGGGNNLDTATTVKQDFKREWELAPFREALERFIHSDDLFVIKHRPTSLHPINSKQEAAILKNSHKHNASSSSSSKHSIHSLLRLSLSDVNKLLLKVEECSSEEREQCVKDPQQTMATPAPGGVAVDITHNTDEIQIVLRHNSWSSESSEENTEHPYLLNEQSLLLLSPVKDEIEDEKDDNLRDSQQSQTPPRTRSIWDDNDDDESTKCPIEREEFNLTNNTNNDENVPSRQSDYDDEYDEESFQSYNSKKSDILVFKPLIAVVKCPISLTNMQLLDDTGNATEVDSLQPYPSIGIIDISIEVGDDNNLDIHDRELQPFLQENKKGCAWVFNMNNDDETELTDDIKQQQSCSESDDSEDYTSSFI